MKLRILLYTLIIFIFYSCNDDDTKTHEVEYYIEIPSVTKAKNDEEKEVSFQIDNREATIMQAPCSLKFKNATSNNKRTRLNVRINSAYKTKGTYRITRNGKEISKGEFEDILNKEIRLK